MTKENIYAVLTGDLVRSSSLKSQRERKKVFDYLKKTLQSLKEFRKEKNEIIMFSNIFRGDAFQGLLSNLSLALRIALFIRAELLKAQIMKEKTEIRISIGFGRIEALNKQRIEESDGEAFRVSGRALDKMKSYRRLALETPSDQLNLHLSVIASLLDAIVFRWTSDQAEVISLWLQNENQVSISNKLSISQPAVQQRLKTAGLFAVEDALEYFCAIISQYKVYN